MPINWERVDKHQIDQRLVLELERSVGRMACWWWVLSGYRSLEEQRILYRKYLAGGPKAAPPGKSAHNFRWAVDLVLDTDPNRPGLQPSWNVKLYWWLLLKKVVNANPYLRHGSDFGDWPHVEWRNWKRAAGESKPWTERA